MQSLGGPFPVALLFLSSPFFEQSCVPIMLPWNKENCEVIGMKRFGIWPCFKLTNPHPVFHCRYNNTGKRHSEHTPAMSPRPKRPQKTGVPNRQRSTEYHCRHPQTLTGGLRIKDPPLLSHGCVPSCVPCSQADTHTLSLLWICANTPQKICNHLCEVKTKSFIIYRNRKLHEKP